MNYTQESSESEYEAENNNEEVKSTKGGRRSLQKTSDGETEDGSKGTSKKRNSLSRGVGKNKKRKQDETETKSVKNEAKKDANKDSLEDSGCVANDDTEVSEGGDDKEYEVEKIVDVRYYEDGDREFLIKWKGFSSKENTWEPEENLNCQAKLKKFLNQIEKVGSLGDFSVH